VWDRDRVRERAKKERKGETKKKIKNEWEKNGKNKK
jgi:hypothetical protein